MKQQPTRTLELKFVAPLPAVEDDYRLISCFVSGRGEGLFLFAENKLGAEHLAPFAGKNEAYPASIPSAPLSYRLVIIDDFKRQNIDIADVSFAAPLFDIFTDRRVVMACRNSAHANGFIFDAASEEKTWLLMGGGLEAISVDDNDRIWASFREEGPMNMYDHPPLETGGPLAGGLTCFNEAGKQIWAFNDYGGGAPFIFDGYALNVMGSGAYIFYYSEFDLAHVSSDFKREIWPTDIAGSHEFAITEDAALFGAQYDDESSDCFHYVRRRAAKLSKSSPVKAVLEFGDWQQNGQVVCRGDEVHYFDENGWFKASIKDLKD